MLHQHVQSQKIGNTQMIEKDDSINTIDSRTINRNTFAGVAPLADEGNGVKSFVRENGDKFLISETGVYIAPGGNEKNIKRICDALSIVAIYRSKDGTGWGRRVEWYDPDGVLHALNIQDSDLTTDAQSVVAALCDCGLGIYCSSQRGSSNLVIEYIKSFPRRACKTMLSTNHLGWFTTKNGTRAFVLSDKNIIGRQFESESVIYSGPDSDIPKYNQKGSLQQWQETVATLAKFSSPIGFAISATFAAPLLELVHEQSGGFHFFGESSTGKSSILRAACSVFASTARGGELGTWRGTDNGLESAFISHCDLPIFLDEIGQADAHQISEIIYMVGNESEKKRSTKYGTSKKTRGWRLMLLSSGEKTVEDVASEVSKSTEMGVEVRLVNIPIRKQSAGGVFDLKKIGKQDPTTLAKALQRTTEGESFGSAGPYFIDKLIKDMRVRGEKTLIEEIIKRRDEVLHTLVAGEKDPAVNRIAYRFALVELAGELAVRYGVVPWTIEDVSFFVKECFHAWRRQFVTSEQKEFDLMQKLVDHFEANILHFIEVKPGSTKPCGLLKLSPLYGYWVEDPEDGSLVFYFTDIFRQLVKPHKLNYVCELLSKYDLLLSNDGYRMKFASGKKNRFDLPPQAYIAIKKALLVAVLTNSSE